MVEDLGITGDVGKVILIVRIKVMGDIVDTVLSQKYPYEFTQKVCSNFLASSIHDTGMIQR